MGEMLRHAPAEGIGDNIKFGDVERIHKVIERVDVISVARRLCP
jgi:hypothetical protein